MSAIRKTNSGQYLVSATLRKQAVLIDNHSLSIIHHFPSHDDNVICIAISPDDRFILTSGLDGKVMLNDLFPGNLLAEVEGHQDVVMAAEFSNCGN